MIQLSCICKLHGPELEKKAPWMDGEVCLKAIATVESSYGVHNIPRHEKAYDVGGTYFNEDLYRKYGSWAACSYSSWQIMFPTAVELGFYWKPQDLSSDAVAIYWVIKYIEKRILDKGATKLQEVFDAYNSGNFRDKNVPEEYISKCMNAYIRHHNDKYKTTV